MRERELGLMSVHSEPLCTPTICHDFLLSVHYCVCMMCECLSDECLSDECLCVLFLEWVSL